DDQRQHEHRARRPHQRRRSRSRFLPALPRLLTPALSKERAMPLFMDVHDKVDGLTAEAVAGAHERDLEVQEKYGVDYRQYWFDEDSGKVFCLVDAPDAAAA